MDTSTESGPDLVCVIVLRLSFNICISRCTFNHTELRCCEIFYCFLLHVITLMVCKKTDSIHINIALMCLYHHCCHGKAIIMMYSEFVPAALVIQPAKCRYCFILSSVARLAVSYFSTLPVKWYDFQGKKLLNIKLCFDFLHNLFLKYFSF
jgi:hypothetical protein